eukprot:2432296-Rhodomonas_salina.4
MEAQGGRPALRGHADCLSDAHAPPGVCLQGDNRKHQKLGSHVQVRGLTLTVGNSSGQAKRRYEQTIKAHRFLPDLHMITATFPADCSSHVLTMLQKFWILARLVICDSRSHSAQ